MSEQDELLEHVWKDVLEMQARAEKAEAERDNLQRLLDAQPSIAARCYKAEAERDIYRAALWTIAYTTVSETDAVGIATNILEADEQLEAIRRSAKRRQQPEADDECSHTNHSP